MSKKMLVNVNIMDYNLFLLIVFVEAESALALSVPI
jgi:hypothetical protein